MLTEKEIIYEIARKAELTLDAARRAYQAMQSIIQLSEKQASASPEAMLPRLIPKQLPSLLQSNS